LLSCADAAVLPRPGRLHPPEGGDRHGRLLAISIVFDAIDTLLKGRQYFAGFGLEYLLRIGVYLVLAAVAAYTPNRRFHAGLAAANLVYQLSWILRSFDVLS
jgi:hypothetical protein